MKRQKTRVEITTKTRRPSLFERKRAERERRYAEQIRDAQIMCQIGINFFVFELEWEKQKLEQLLAQIDQLKTLQAEQQNAIFATDTHETLAVNDAPKKKKSKKKEKKEPQTKKKCLEF
ncbi:MAG: hypothetical protein J6V22_07265 [Clostridia bacterium]|nr:hypothetical protein [Clostridia bacterium]